VVPAQTARTNRDPSRWTHPAIPASDWPAARLRVPPFDPRTSPSEGMGAVAECVRIWPGSVRSAHPQTSFAAVGRRAAELMEHHELESPLGERSPLTRLEKADASVLLLGVGYERCTAFH